MSAPPRLGFAAGAPTEPEALPARPPERWGFFAAAAFFWPAAAPFAEAFFAPRGCSPFTAAPFTAAFFVAPFVAAPERSDAAFAAAFFRPALP